jgi:lipid-A-disaccharide synthase
MVTDSSIPHFFLIAGEESGDRLGTALMQALKARTSCKFSGVGGGRMSAEGLTSLFPMEDLAVMGILPVLARLPRLVQRVYEVVGAIKRLEPHVLILIDSPEFTHAVARRVRRCCPRMMIIDYVSPSVWAWRPGRARRMASYIDHVLALFPFEPEAYRRLHGPPCHYVGHPLVDRIPSVFPQRVDGERKTVLLMPGSRKSEVRRLLPIFRQVMITVQKTQGDCLKWVLPTVPHMLCDVKREVSTWDTVPDVVCGGLREDIYSTAQAALVASGTATLELALSSVPMVITYKVSSFEALLARWLVHVPAVGLPNIVLHFIYKCGPAFPEFLQESCTPERISAALVELLRLDSVAYKNQQKAFHQINNVFRSQHEQKAVSCGDRAAQAISTLCAHALP